MVRSPGEAIISVAILCAAAVGGVRGYEAIQAHQAEDHSASEQSTPKRSSAKTSARQFFRLVGDPCKELFIGEGRLVEMNWRQSPTQVGAHYAVHRKTQNEYEILLNLRFKADGAYDGRVSRSHVDDHYRRHARSCIRDFGGKLSDRLGRRIKLRIVPDNDKDLKSVVPAAPLISVSQSGIRDSSRRWSSDIACPVVLHELMHLIGLVDEYEPIPAWRHSETNNCRVTGPASSVMRSSWSVTRHARALWPGHMNAVLYPACQERNVRYYTCAKGAYRGRSRNDGCPDWNVKERLLCFEQCDETDCDWLE